MGYGSNLDNSETASSVGFPQDPTRMFQSSSFLGVFLVRILMFLSPKRNDIGRLTWASELPNKNWPEDLSLWDKGKTFGDLFGGRGIHVVSRGSTYPQRRSY